MDDAGDSDQMTVPLDETTDIMKQYKLLQVSPPNRCGTTQINPCSWVGEKDLTLQPLPDDENAVMKVKNVQLGCKRLKKTSQFSDIV